MKTRIHTVIVALALLNAFQASASVTITQDHWVRELKQRPRAE
jgi:hypothetical protein